MLVPQTLLLLMLLLMVVMAATVVVIMVLVAEYQWGFCFPFRIVIGK